MKSGAVPNCIRLTRELLTQFRKLETHGSSARATVLEEALVNRVFKTLVIQDYSVDQADVAKALDILVKDRSMVRRADGNDAVLRLTAKGRSRLIHGTPLRAPERVRA